MEPEIAGAANHGSGASSQPAPSNRRWTVRRKAAIVEAVRSGRVSLDAICQAYKPLDRGVPGVGARHGPVWRSRSARDPVSNLSSDRDAKDRLKMAPRNKLTEQLALLMLTASQRFGNCTWQLLTPLGRGTPHA